MFKKSQNYHHSKLPEIGELHIYRGRKLIVESFSLSDNGYPYGFGIHTANVRYLANGQPGKLSGRHLQESITNH